MTPPSPILASATSRVAAIAAADAGLAVAHLDRRLAVETDPSDVHADLEALGVGGAPFVLVDARAPEAYADAHLPGAISLPWQSIDADTVASHLPADSLVVTYCWSIHCNAATRAAARLAALGVPVKEMIGGFDAWRAEGRPVVEPA